MKISFGKKVIHSNTVRLLLSFLSEIHLEETSSLINSSEKLELEMQRGVVIRQAPLR